MPAADAVLSARFCCAPSRQGHRFSYLFSLRRRALGSSENQRDPPSHDLSAAIQLARANGFRLPAVCGIRNERPPASCRVVLPEDRVVSNISSLHLFGGIMLASYSRLRFSAFWLTFSLLCVIGVQAQSGGSASINGTVTDATGAVVPNAKIEVRNPVSGFSHTSTSDANGTFSIANVPFNTYHLTVSGQGFAPYAGDVDVRSSVPVNVNVTLKVVGSQESVTVEADGGDLVENTPTFHTDVDRGLFKLPLESQSSSVSSLVTLSTPGIAADSIWTVPRHGRSCAEFVLGHLHKRA